MKLTKTKFKKVKNGKVKFDANPKDCSVLAATFCLISKIENRHILKFRKITLSQIQISFDISVDNNKVLTFCRTKRVRLK